jgi:hypothetical protein
MDRVTVDRLWERVRAAPADEQPVGQKRSTTPAMAMPKPTHMQAMP